MKITMKDVAKKAGVGVGTVSRVVNGVKVKASTYEKVHAAIESLNYEPDEYARGLKTNRSNTIALIIPTIWHPFFSKFAYYVEEALSEKKYKLYLCNADGRPEKEAEYIQMNKQNKVDGIIAITYSDIDQFISSNLPLVSIDRHFSDEVAYVVADNYRGGQIAANKLIEFGCHNLAYIGGTSPYPNETNDRKAAFYEVCKKNHFPVKILDMPEPISDLHEQLNHFLSINSEIDGIFTINDFMALNVIKVMKQFGKTAPKDYQIIGFDGVKMACETDYVVSTIVQPLKEMAEASVEILLKKIFNEPTEQRVVFPVHFHSGGTTIL
ncbi:MULTISPECIES: LacI family DNA-binding transcriptional regulator [unclassified Enterococcus]|uniref:LacI family DNA-binding transcriptional regulator n=1 Tax=unclassified Enterococcus TaxID=2608891 RepID=UPI001551AAE9|nr:MULTISPECIES: LacI family DNA-binding transcriptional regulator [unclassified Enterococcus]MBS7577777.1 LacI family DNA-binding transcriptional regulator [Enterococcus sp. MMGLQ5-2]MBS7585037.1 LacI family DNA-binding transcriptional regulator [Enterococcus sp. MMGLQ5-1]NPD12893.1 LacI family DNA-binding transcriptional regulator [Enterococcus sp. MMGLQ5-1]NPD37607.1 LacI family DNA-binding transcriptional regulator [Enterococcus sp. MMGLQ5-2]